MIFLTVAVEADRTGRRYGDKVDPEEPIEAGTGVVDATLVAATRWLKQSSGCGY